MSETPPTLYCANHPKVETLLRCNQCGKPICPKCVVSTPTGYRCAECVRGQQRIFDTAVWYDFVTAAAICLVLSYLGSLVVRYIGFFTIFVAPLIGGAIAELTRLAVRRRRSQRLYFTAGVAAAIGSIPLLVPSLALIFNYASGWALLPLIWQGVYTALITSTVFYRLGGIRK